MGISIVLKLKVFEWGLKPFDYWAVSPRSEERGICPDLQVGKKVEEGKSASAHNIGQVEHCSHLGITCDH